MLAISLCTWCDMCTSRSFVVEQWPCGDRLLVMIGGVMWTESH